MFLKFGLHTSNGQVLFATQKILAGLGLGPGSTVILIVPLISFKSHLYPLREANSHPAKYQYLYDTHHCQDYPMIPTYLLTSEFVTGLFSSHPIYSARVGCFPESSPVNFLFNEHDACLIMDKSLCYYRKRNDPCCFGPLQNVTIDISILSIHLMSF